MTGPGRVGRVLIVLVALLAACTGATDDSKSAHRQSNLRVPVESTGSGRETVSKGEWLASEHTEVLQIVGNRLIARDGTTVHLHGVVRSGTEYACAQGWGIHDTASVEGARAEVLRLIDQAQVAGANAVRVNLNEHCWLGRNGANPTFSGAAYRTEMIEFVEAVRARGLYVVLALMWGDSGSTLGIRQPQMANRDHSTDLWTSVAPEFADDHGVLFELFGEPAIGEDWACWRDGCDYKGYPVAGMQALVDAVRATGARNPVIVSGLRHANDLSGWLEFAPDDPFDQMAAGFHLYDFNACIDVDCWDEEIAPVAAEVPVITAEVGETWCTGDFVRTFIEWALPRGVSFLAWALNSQDDCHVGPALLEDTAGTLTPYGREYFRLIEEIGQ